MWIIMGTSPQLPEGEILFGDYAVREGKVVSHDGVSLHLERGIETLATAACLVCQHVGVQPPKILCAGDKGKGDGSRAVYAFIEKQLLLWAEQAQKVRGMTFHYLFPDVDWHNRVLMALDAYEAHTNIQKRPFLLADAGFMYVAKMSGYADAYDLFTPDVGEMAFLADELAPHPFYTRGFLLDSPDSIENLLARAHKHGNVAKNLIIKGSIDYVVQGETILHTVHAPSVPTMEAIGGTGDLVTGISTGLLAAGYDVTKASFLATKTNRMLAQLAQPTPATQVCELTPYLCEALEHVLRES